VIIAAIITVIVITSISQRLADEFLFFKITKRILDTNIKEIMNIIVFVSILKKSFITFLIETLIVFLSKYDSVLKTSLSPILKI